ncbi:MAG: DUF973 family protein [Thermoplasmata archaeon]
MKVCLACGQVAENTDAFCPRCGTPLPASAAATPAPVYVYQMPAPPPPSPEEWPSMERFRTASLLGMIAFLISTASGAVAIVYLRGALLLNTTHNTVTISSNVIPLLWFSAGVEAISLAILIGSLYYYRQAFVGLRDRASTFSTPATLAVLAIVGAAILIAGALVEVQYTVGVINCLNQPGGTTNSCVGGRAVLASLGLVGVAAIVFFIGLLGGLIGVWRVGVRYQTDLPRIGAVLSIFPYINWIGMLLNYVGAAQIRSRLRGGRGPGPGGGA